MCLQMEIKSYNPVRIIFGIDCVRNNMDVFKSMGRFPLIVTGRSGAKNLPDLFDLRR